MFSSNKGRACTEPRINKIAKNQTIERLCTFSRNFKSKFDGIISSFKVSEQFFGFINFLLAYKIQLST